jgi:phosphopentomutase
VGGFRLPNLEALGLGCCAPIEGLRAVDSPRAAYGTCQPASPGKDSTTGHWEICGHVLSQAFPTYPEGFPAEVIDQFAARTGRGVVGNKAASGTVILEELARHHVLTGDWIVYTSADSVFQVAAHEGIVPLTELYDACAIARSILQPPHGVSRVIARPFVGQEGKWTRTEHRRDLSLAPPGPTLLDLLRDRHVPRVGVGKVDDLFAGRNILSVHTATNHEAYRMIRDALGTMERGLLFANVIEFDQTWGHRNDVAGFYGGLQELDAVLPDLLAPVKADDLVIFTADHGNDPTTPSTDHSREVVPLLVYGPRVRPVALGRRFTFADIGQTVAEFLGSEPQAAGTSFLHEVWS